MSVRPATLQAAFEAGLETLKNSGIATPEIDASLLIEKVTGTSKLQRMTHPETPVNEHDWNIFTAYIARRADCEPVHRIIGARSFYGLELELNKATLVPRPDTEILIDTVLPFVKKCTQNVGECTILDLGTGTGAIALALLNNDKKCQAIGVDFSEDALVMAQKNALKNGLSDRFVPLLSNWFESVVGQFDLIVSNPPYIASDVIDSLDIDVKKHDPKLALDGGADGLDVYRILANNCCAFIKDGGRIAVEIGFDQKTAVIALFERAGLRLIESADDLNGQNRVLFFTI